MFFSLVVRSKGGSFVFYSFAFMHSYLFPHCFLHFVYSHSQGLIFIEHSYVFPHCFLHFVYSHSQGLSFIDYYACVALNLVFIVTFFYCFWVYKVSCERMQEKIVSYFWVFLSSSVILCYMFFWAGFFLGFLI